MHPLILQASDHAENLSIHPLFQQHVAERLHQRTNPILGPIGKMVVQHQPLPKQRMRPPLHRIRLQPTVVPDALARRAQHRQRMGSAPPEHWKSLCIMHLATCPNQNSPTDSADAAVVSVTVLTSLRTATSSGAASRTTGRSAPRRPHRALRRFREDDEQQALRPLRLCAGEREQRCPRPRRRASRTGSTSRPSSTRPSATW